nr:recombinase family protein [Nitrospirota bacterium]
MKGTTSKSSAEPKSVGIWIRVSTEDQAQGESPEHHEKRAEYYALAKGWEVVKVYHLEAVSGKSVIEHPEAKRMIEDVKAGHISGLIFSKLARLARNTRELLDFAEIFRNHNADLISLEESIDTSTPVGRFFYTLIAAMAQWEREEIAARIAASVPIRAKLGKPLGGAAPFGYQWVNRQLVPDPKEAPIRRVIYDLFIEHRRKKTVARLLNDAGHRTRNGSKFSDTTVARLIRDTTAKGIRLANYTKTTGENKKWVLKPKEEWVELPCEAIVSHDIWDRANAILDDRKLTGKRPTRKPVHLFTGFAFCTCGQKMYVPSANPKYTCYKCHTKIGVKDLEAVFQEQLKGFFFSDSEIAKYLADADQAIKEKQELLASTEEECRKLRQEIDKIMQLYMNEKLSTDTIGFYKEPREERLRQLSDRIPELQGELDFLKIKHLSSDQIIAEAKDLYTRWRHLGSEEKRKILETITERITVGKTEVHIELCYLPPPSEIAAGRQRGFRDSSPPPT